MIPTRIAQVQIRPYLVLLTAPFGATKIAPNKLGFVPEEATMSLVKIIVITVLIILSILFFGRFLSSPA